MEAGKMFSVGILTHPEIGSLEQDIETDDIEEAREHCRKLNADSQNAKADRSAKAGEGD